MQSIKKVIEIRSHNSNNILNIYTDDYNEAIEHINAKFEDEDILKDITINHINAQNLSNRHIDMIKDYLRDELDVDYQEMAVPKAKRSIKHDDIKLKTVKDDDGFYGKIDNKSSAKANNTKLKKNENAALTDYASMTDNEYKTKIIKHSMRSGASQHYDGNIIVIGDVNAGAELVATGNIIIFGVLRGVARAGVKGDRSAMVIAYKIAATQLRIAGYIAIPPKDDNKYYMGIQMAIIRDDEIEIQQIN